MANTLSKVTSISAGSVSAPGLYLGSDTTTGLYRVSANNIGVSVSGIQTLIINSAGLTVAGGIVNNATETSYVGRSEFNYSSSSHSYYLVFRKSGLSGSTQTNTVNGDQFGSMQFSGYASGYNVGATIVAQQDGSAGASFVPGKFIFQTRDSGGTMTTALTISAAQLATFAGGVTVTGTTTLSAALAHSGSTLGFFGTSPQTKGTITGSRGSNAALASLLTYLATIGLLTNNTTT